MATRPPFGPSPAGLVLRAFLEVREIDVRDKVAFVDQADALIRQGWDPAELACAAATFAALHADPANFWRWLKR